jgi:DnaK suppressor protein
MGTLTNEAREALIQRRRGLRARGDQAEQAREVGVLSEREHQELRDIDAALVRIQDGDFGRCARCGGAIGRYRLLAIPETRYCLTCSAMVGR